MASLKCGKCKEGIHYHGEPNGIELHVFSSDVWKEVIESKYNPEAPKMHTEYLTPSPYFYTSETILHDFKGMYCDIWRCPNCGTLHVFDAADGNRVASTYVPAETPFEVDTNQSFTHVIYDDFAWFEFYETPTPNTELEQNIPPTYYAVVSGNRLALFKDKKLSQFAGCYQALDESIE
ncbi:MAG: hypothetical protein II561_10750 [Thermoguttaceae bacterium]|nr:hypothetical protein [Thermoguttaceae bacterium]MBQ2557018.1 hypothetical protein [Thermoguttaceae bacterium]